MRNLLETIYIKDKKARYLNYHNMRFNRSRQEIFGIKDTLDLSTVISAPTNDLYRCRVVYNKNIELIEYIPYVYKDIKSLSFVSSDLDYRYKYEDRESLNNLDFNSSDDVIIIKNGLVTDTTIANLAFLQKDRWITPSKPLLKGTTRERLIDSGFLIERDIKKDDILAFDGIALMNAMVGFKIIKPILIY
jgi:4-amino-4-deoxychorismate lyase